jgi:hypothetical protein
VGPKKGARRRANHKAKLAREAKPLPWKRDEPKSSEVARRLANDVSERLTPFMAAMGGAFIGGLSGAELGAGMPGKLAKLARALRERAPGGVEDVVPHGTEYHLGWRQGFLDAADFVERYRG